MAQRLLSMQGRLELWADHAHDVLTETAQVLHLAITDADLARIVQERSGETSQVPQRSWLPKVLRIVAQRCHDADEPPLTALVVRSTDHKVGPDYAVVTALTGAEGDPEELAAEGRLDCYRRHAVDVPDDAQPNLHPVTALVDDPRGVTKAPRGRTPRATTPKAPRAPKAPKVSASAKKEEKPPAICPSCFMQLPLSGVCPSCT